MDTTIINLKKNMQKLFFFILMIITTNIFGQGNTTKIECPQLAEVDSIKNVIRAVDSVFLMELFINKYINNKNYFNDTDLDTTDKSEKFRNSNTLINAIKFTDLDSIKKVCERVENFNKNYVTLFKVRADALNQRYDSIKVINNINIINKLPVLDSESSLFKRKEHIIKLLNTYKANSDSLLGELKKYIPKKDQKAIGISYLKLEKDDKYKDYPYLISIIEKTRKKASDFKEEDLK